MGEGKDKRFRADWVAEKKLAVRVKSLVYFEFLDPSSYPLGWKASTEGFKPPLIVTMAAHLPLVNAEVLRLSNATDEDFGQQ